MTGTAIFITTVLILSLLFFIYFRRRLPIVVDAEGRPAKLKLSRRQILLFSVIPLTFAIGHIVVLFADGDLRILPLALLMSAATLYAWWSAWRTPSGA